MSNMRKILAAFVLLLCTGVALADPTRDQVMSGAARCDAITDNRTWLDCFYGSAQPMRAELGLPAAPPSQVFLVPRDNGQPPPRVATAPAQQDGGFLTDLFGNLKFGNQRMRDYSFNSDGMFVVTLANGQVWRQVGDAAVRAKWEKPPGSYVVDINSAVLGGYNMRVRGESHSYKVRLVRQGPQ
jgi:hypothetical protein